MVVDTILFGKSSTDRYDAQQNMLSKVEKSLIVAFKNKDGFVEWILFEKLVEFE